VLKTHIIVSFVFSIASIRAIILSRYIAGLSAVALIVGTALLKLVRMSALRCWG